MDHGEFAHDKGSCRQDAAFFPRDLCKIRWWACVAAYPRVGNKVALSRSQEDSVVTRGQMES